MQKKSMSRAEILKNQREAEEKVRRAKMHAHMGQRIGTVRDKNVPKRATAIAKWAEETALEWVLAFHHFIAPATLVDHIGAVHVYIVSSKIPYLLKALMIMLLLALAPVFVCVYLIEFIPYGLMFLFPIWPMQWVVGRLANFGLTILEREVEGMRITGLVIKKWGKVIENSNWNEDGQILHGRG